MADYTGVPCPVCGSKTTSEWFGGGKYIRRCRNWQAESDDQFCVRGTRKTCAFEGGARRDCKAGKAELERCGRRIHE